MRHPEFEKLVKNFEGLLSLTGEREISAHLETCAGCAASAAKLEDFFGYASVKNTEQVSQADTARLLNIFKPERTIPEKGESFAGRLLANLVFDDWRWAVSERFVATDTRHLLYRAGKFEIDLRLLFAGGKCQVSGQIFPDCSKKASIAEIFSGEKSERVFLNPYCEFVFPPIDEGTYDIRINAGGEIIEIENLSLVN